jgi:FkbM family methyltransferase
LRRTKDLAWRVILRLGLERAVIAVRVSRAVNEPVALLWAESLGGRSGQPRRFTLRRSDRAIHIRPRSSDLRVFHEIFCYQGYALPDRARSILEEKPIAVDAGAHIGLFTVFLCDAEPRLKVKAFEPDPDNAALARLNLRPLIDAGRVELVEAAAGTFDGQISFLTGLGMISRRASSSAGQQASVPQVDLFAHLDGVGLLKLDVEGAEWDILRDPRWREHLPACLVMEWHGLIDDQLVADPEGEAVRLLVGFGEVDSTVFHPGMVGHVWAFR